VLHSENKLQKGAKAYGDAFGNLMLPYVHKVQKENIEFLVLPYVALN
jgi:hypothetical protein